MPASNLTLTDFYNLPVIKTIDNPIYFLMANDYLLEVNALNTFNWNTQQSLKSNNADSRVQVKVIKELTGRSGTIYPIKQWVLASVWYLSQPCMVLKNIEYILSPTIGPNYFITDSTVHSAFVGDILSLEKETKIIDLSTDPNSFNNRAFYGDSILEDTQIINRPDIYNQSLCITTINNTIDRLNRYYPGEM